MSRDAVGDAGGDAGDARGAVGPTRSRTQAGTWDCRQCCSDCGAAVRVARVPTGRNGDRGRGSRSAAAASAAAAAVAAAAVVLQGCGVTLRRATPRVAMVLPRGERPRGRGGRPRTQGRGADAEETGIRDVCAPRQPFGCGCFCRDCCCCGCCQRCCGAAGLPCAEPPGVRRRCYRGGKGLGDAGMAGDAGDVRARRPEQGRC